MEVCETKAEMRRVAAALREGGASLGLVPTMGALHAGHMALVAAARAACDRVVASLFVNPTQFGPNEDLASYPRTLERDLAMFREAGVAAVFAPAPEEMYRPGAETVVEATRLGRVLMGRLRPGHFRGVATVVTKLLNIVQPDAAFFGEKDFQQLAVIRTVVRDLDIPVRIVGVPTVREPDGLAMSSRNVRLSAAERGAAPVLARALAAGAAALAGGATARWAEAAVRAVLREEPLAQVRAVDLRDAETLAHVKGRPGRPVVILLAVRIGDVTLIDQRVVPAQKGSP